MYQQNPLQAAQAPQNCGSCFCEDHVPTLYQGVVYTADLCELEFVQGGWSARIKAPMALLQDQ